MWAAAAEVCYQAACEAMLASQSPNGPAPAAPVCIVIGDPSIMANMHGNFQGNYQEPFGGQQMITFPNFVSVQRPQQAALPMHSSFSLPSSLISTGTSPNLSLADHLPSEQEGSKSEASVRQLFEVPAEPAVQYEELDCPGTPPPKSRFQEEAFPTPSPIIGLGLRGSHKPFSDEAAKWNEKLPAFPLTVIKPMEDDWSPPEAWVEMKLAREGVQPSGPDLHKVNAYVPPRLEQTFEELEEPWKVDTYIPEERETPHAFGSFCPPPIQHDYTTHHGQGSEQPSYKSQQVPASNTHQQSFRIGSNSASAAQANHTRYQSNKHRQPYVSASSGTSTNGHTNGSQGPRFAPSSSAQRGRRSSGPASSKSAAWSSEGAPAAATDNKKSASNDIDAELPMLYNIMEQILLRRPELEAGKRVQLSCEDWLSQCPQLSEVPEGSGDRRCSACPARALVNRALRHMSRRLPGCAWTVDLENKQVQVHLADVARFSKYCDGL